MVMIGDCADRTRVVTISCMKLSVVMPVYNERSTLRTMVERVLGVPMEIELLCVDDGSRDGSREILGELEKQHAQLCRDLRADGVVPFAVEWVWAELHKRHFFVGDFFAFLVGCRVNFGSYSEPFCRGGVADEFNNNGEAFEGLAAPVLSDVAEHTVFDLVPLAGAGRQMAHLYGDACSLAKRCKATFHKRPR